MRRLDARTPDFQARFDAFLGAARGDQESTEQIVRPLVQDVRQRGDAALFELTKRFDNTSLTPDTIRVSDEELAAAESQCDQTALAALGTAAARIEAYHRRQLPKDEWFSDDTGAKLGWRWTSLDSVGIYVPGGTASYPSSVLMNAVPAR